MLEGTINYDIREKKNLVSKRTILKSFLKKGEIDPALLKQLNYNRAYVGEVPHNKDYRTYDSIDRGVIHCGMIYWNLPKPLTKIYMKKMKEDYKVELEHKVDQEAKILCYTNMMTINKNNFWETRIIAYNFLKSDRIILTPYVFNNAYDVRRIEDDVMIKDVYNDLLKLDKNKRIESIRFEEVDHVERAIFNRGLNKHFIFTFKGGLDISLKQDTYNIRCVDFNTGRMIKVYSNYEFAEKKKPEILEKARKQKIINEDDSSANRYHKFELSIHRFSLYNYAPSDLYGSRARLMIN